MARGHCPTCNCIQDLEYLGEDEEDRGDEKGDGEAHELSSRVVFCTVCGEEFPFSSTTSNGNLDSHLNHKYLNYKIGQIITVDEIPKKKDLKKVLINISNGDEGLIQIVTNAKYVEIGWKVVVALKGAIVPAGSHLDEDSDAILVSPTSVGGVKSDGMICDSYMLGWSGGAKGVIQQLPDSYEIGTSPPNSRPRTE
jgi:tRNA-binding EMAP/Myf-like protein